MRHLNYVVMSACILCSVLSYAETGSGEKQETNVQTSAFGSWAARAGLFDHERSDCVPEDYLMEPGSLQGHWRERDEKAELKINSAADDDAPYSEKFIIELENAGWSFTACYRSFLVFGCDITGDGKDELIIEFGSGRGTNVHRRRLLILKHIEGQWQEIFHNWMSGYLLDQRRMKHLMWQLQYRLISAVNGGYNLELALVPLDVAPEHVNDEEYLSWYEQPVVVYNYCGETEKFQEIDCSR